MARRPSRPLFEGGAPVVAQASKAPTISANGVVPLYGSSSVIQPGEWVSIFGTNLAGGTAVWKGDFPTSLGGTNVWINGKPAYLSMVSPGQINLQAPDDTATGKVTVVVGTSNGIATSTVTLNQVSPAFELRDATHVSAIIIRSDGSGFYGNGAYDILGPDGNCFGYTTVGREAGRRGGKVFGHRVRTDQTPTVPAGKVFSGAAPINNAFSLYLNNVLIEPTFVGLSSAGVYQINLVIPPGIGQGDVPILASVGGIQTQPHAVLSLQGVTASAVCAYTGVTAVTAQGDGGGGDGGSGGGVMAAGLAGMAVTAVMAGGVGGDGGGGW